MRAAGLVLVLLVAGCGPTALSSPSTAPSAVPESASGAGSAVPEPSASASSQAELGEGDYVERDGFAFTVLDHPEADALFEDVQECRSELQGLTVEFPQSWFTNANPPPDCSWFGAEPVDGEAEVRTVALVRPPHVAISISVSRTGLGQIPEWPRVLHEEIQLGGLRGHRSEAMVPGQPAEFHYGYAVWLDADPYGWKLTAGTSSAGHDYELNKAVLDRMMASLRFLDAGAASATPPPGYVLMEGDQFSVLASSEADDLFATPDTCTNPADGYEVTFPDAWYTNTEVDATPACSWFTPDFFEVTQPGEVPGEIWITIELVDGVIAHTGITEIFLNEEVLRYGESMRRVESNPFPNKRPGYRTYQYAQNIGSPGSGPSLLASVESDAVGDYHLANAVLDRMMETLRLVAADAP